MPATYLGHDPGGINPDHAPDATLTTFRAQATTIYYQLRDAHIRAAGAVEGALLLDAGARGGFQTELRAVVQNMSLLGPNGSLTNAVLNGERPVSAWQSVADATAETLRHVMVTLGEAAPTIGRLWSEVVKPTAEQAGQQAKQALELGADLLPWVVVGAVALVIAYVVFTFRR